MNIAIVTAGGAGMYCGSCMHDNTWAHGLLGLGLEVTLIPTYTPIRVDEADASLQRVFFGGLNVYLNSRSALWRRLPRFVKQLVDHPAVIRWATKRAVSNDARELGDLTLSMLAGEHGPHREAGEELVTYLVDVLKPDVVIFSNALLSGVLPQLRSRFPGAILCTLQGDDVFLDSLPESHRQQVIELISEHAKRFDGFLTHSRFYREYICQYLGLPVEKTHTLPLSIDLTGHVGEPHVHPDRPYTVGYFARIAPEKGLHHLVEAFIRLRDELPESQLRIGGYLPPQHTDYLNGLLAQLSDFGADCTYVGSPATHEGKVQFLSSIDVLSVPTEFQEPKGLYVLEALANGVPVVQPEHGAFPELLAATAGGLLVPPRDPVALAAALLEFSDGERRLNYARRGWDAVREHHSAEAAAIRTLEVLKAIVTI